MTPAIPDCSPDRILQSALAGHAVAATLATACQHRLFTHIEGSATATVHDVASRAQISVRGAQALLDALTALGLLRVHDGQYRNAEDARSYLVEGKPSYLGDYVQLTHSPFGDAFRDLSEVVRSGVPRFQYTADVADNRFWEKLVLAIVPLAMPVVDVFLRSPRAHQQGLRMLDIGGGSGVYSARLLQQNASAQATQIDWPNVNEIGRRFVAHHGVIDRFHTLDGDFHVTDFGTSAYDLVLLSNICHQESPADNLALFRRTRQALKPGGALVISEFLLEDDRRSSAPWCGIFQIFMLLQTRAGAAWRRADLQDWLEQAGFSTVEFQATPTPSTLIWAEH